MAYSYLWLFILCITSLTASTSGQTNSSDTSNSQHECSFHIPNVTKEELQTIRTDFSDGKYEIIRVDLDVLIHNSDQELKRRTYKWVLVTHTGYNLMKHTPEYDVATLQRHKITERGVTILVRFDKSKCKLEENKVVLDLATQTIADAVKSVDELSGICYHFTEEEGHSIIKIGHPRLKCMMSRCNFTNSEDCTVTIGRSFLGFFATIWTYFVLLYSPIVVYWLYDNLYIRQNNHLFYTMKEVPYSFKRLLIMLSYFAVYWFSCKKMKVNSRPIFRTGLLLWCIAVAITVRNVVHYRSTSRHYLFNIEIKFLPEDMSLDTQTIVYSVVLVVFMGLLLGILYSCTYEVPHKISTDPLVYCWSSTGSIKSLSIKKKQIANFTKHKASDLNEGQWFILQHAERFALLASVKFWKWVFRESFSMLTKKRRSILIKLLLIPVGLVVGCIYAILGIVLNLLWGLFPLFGIFFSFVSSVSSWISLFRVFIVTFIMLVFLQILVTNSVLFILNLLIYSLYAILPSEGGEDGSTNMHIFVFIGYAFLYWHQFSKQYKNLLAIIFEVENENLNEESETGHYVIDSFDNPNAITESELESQREKVSQISIKKFDFISDYCSPVRKRMIGLIIKIILTTTFLLVGVTIVSMKNDAVILSNTTSVFSRLTFFVMPVIIQYLYARSMRNDSEDIEQLRQKVIVVIKEWKEPEPEQEETDDDVHTDETDDVECGWITRFCNGKKETKDKDKKYQASTELGEMNDKSKEKSTDVIDTAETSLYTEL